MCDNCEWEEFRNNVTELLMNEAYEFAQDTLTGIYEWVDKNGHVTDRQKEAVLNISLKRSK